MDAEQFLQNLPRPVLVIGAIVLGIVIIMILSPPHTVCDAQTTQAQEALVGIVQPRKVNKQTMPPEINRALESCYQARTTGACYDYFQILRELSKRVMGSITECRPEVYSIKDIRENLELGVTNMALLAWGDEPPAPGAFNRFGPLQDSEIALFCYMKSAIIAGRSEDEWHKIRKKVFAELPGEKAVLPTDPKESLKPPRAANLLMSELDIWNRSLFSVRCENYL